MRQMKRPIGLLPSGLALVLCSILTMAMVIWAAPGSLRGALAGMLRQPRLLILNWLPIFLLTLAFACLLRNVFFSAAAVNLAAVGMAVGNRVKLLVRDEPFLPKDLVLLKEAADAAGNYDLNLPWHILGASALTALVLVALGLAFPLRLRISSGPRAWAARLGGGAAALGALVCAVAFLYSSTGLYNSFTVSNPYYLPSVCNELGFPYFFCYHFSTYKLVKPEGFNREEAKAYETGDQPAAGADVHVVMVMNEAFSDLTNHSAFAYSEEDDPLKRLNALRAGENSLFGHIVVPNFAGGTANTEFDVMSGMQTNAISNSGSSFRTFNRNLDSVLRVFRSAGYHTLFMHPGHAWFYNRENVYAYLGADELMFAEDIPALEYKGSWATDQSLARSLIGKFEESAAAGERFCGFAVTIQNHMSYTPDKYGPDYSFSPVRTNIPLSKEAETLLSVYIEGLRDADRMLGQLEDYFSASAEPVVLVWFGDHLPYLGDGRLAYEELGLLGEDPFAAYETPWLIWYNDAARAALEDRAEGLDLPEDGVISASFLGAVVLELTGHREDTPWFSFLSGLRRELPVVHNGQYHDAGGTLTEVLSPEQSRMVEKWRSWSYYKLNYKKIP